MTQQVIAIACAVLLAAGNASLYARQASQPAEASVKIPPDQLDALVAPIALYPDQLLSQTLVASTYPLEIIQLEQWLQKNQGLKDKALVDAVSKQPWDPSIQALAALPDLAKRLANDIQWTTDLGNAFLAQESDVMQAVQRMRAKAEGTGALTSNEQQKVQSEVIDNKKVIVIEQANPEVVYVPSYNPVAVYGQPVYPYPSIYYPPYTPGAYLAANAISWGLGVAMGAAWGGGWGWGAGWGHNDININRNNTFNRNTNFNAVNRTGNRNTWQHNPQHRGGAPYADRATANRFGSNARGDSLASRQRGAAQQISRQHGNLGSVANRSAGNLGAANRGGAAGRGNVGAAAGRAKPGTTGRSNIGGAGSARNFGGANGIGNRSVGSGSSFGNRGGFNGGSRGFSGSAARSSFSRGSSSMGSARRGGGGGRSRGGGGGRRGGGGGRRGGGGGRR
jgi:hypothetical protein